MFDLMFQGEGLSSRLPYDFRDISTQGTYLPFTGKKLSNKPLDPFIVFDKGLLRKDPKDIRYVAAHELGHAKDYHQISKRVNPKKFRALVTLGSREGAETRGAKIHMPFLREHYGADALSDFQKKNLILSENMGSRYKPGGVSKHVFLKELTEAFGADDPMVKARLGWKGQTKGLIPNPSTAYKNLAKIARKHGLMGLLMATMLTAVLSGEEE